MKHIIEQCIAEFKVKYPEVAIPSIKFNGRLRRTGGRAMFNRRDKPPVRIELSSQYLTTEERVKDVLMHELAHVVAGIGAGHGPDWVKVMDTLGYKPEVTHNYKIEFACPSCNLKHLRQLPKKGYRWLCTCGAVLNKA